MSSSFYDWIAELSAAEFTMVDYPHHMQDTQDMWVKAMLYNDQTSSMTATASIFPWRRYSISKQDKDFFF